MGIMETVENYRPIPQKWHPISTPFMEGTRASLDKEADEWPISRIHIMTREYALSVPEDGPLDNPKTIELLLDAATRDPHYVIFALHALVLQQMGPTFKTTYATPYTRTTECGRKTWLRQRCRFEGEDAGFVYETDYALDILSEAAVDAVNKMCKKIISTTPLGGRAC